MRRSRRAMVALVSVAFVAGALAFIVSRGIQARGLREASAGTDGEAQYAVKIAGLPRDAEICAIAGGRWAADRCVVPMRDVGAACTSSDQCDGVCLSSPAQAGGVCSAQLPVLGCNVELGRSGARSVCRD